MSDLAGLRRRRSLNGLGQSHQLIHHLCSLVPVDGMALLPPSERVAAFWITSGIFLDQGPDVRDHGRVSVAPRLQALVADVVGLILEMVEQEGERRQLAKQDGDCILHMRRLELDEIIDRLAGALEGEELHVDEVAHSVLPRPHVCFRWPDGGGGREAAE
jgi:hypothetical protein